MLSHLIQLIESACSQTDLAPRLKISDRFADAQLQNQFGKWIRFRDEFVNDGRALLINTMYTTCRGSCPGTSATFESLRETLSPVFGSKLSMVSLTLDPVVDTRHKLLEYAKLYGADRPRPELCDWQFLTGTRAEVNALRRSLGFYDLNPRVDQDVTQHDSLLLFGNSTTDRWAAMPAQLKQSQLVTTVRRVAGFTFEQKYGIRP